MFKSIYKYNETTGKMTCLYRDIESQEDIDLLAQYAMCQKDPWNELIFVTPGFNRSIKENHPEQYKKAQQLAKEHEYKINT
jgi:hypothetical protein